MNTEPGGVLALDLAQRTGWAYGLVGAPQPLAGVWVLGGTSLVERCDGLINRLTDFIVFQRPRLIVCEAPLPVQRQMGTNAARQQFSLANAAELAGHWNDVEVVEESADNARIGVLGKSRFGGREQTKKAVLSFVASKGWFAPDDNAGDALVLWAHACALRWKKGKAA